MMLITIKRVITLGSVTFTNDDIVRSGFTALMVKHLMQKNEGKFNEQN